MESKLVTTKNIYVIDGKPVAVPIELDDKPRDLRKEEMSRHAYCEFMARMLVKYGPKILAEEKSEKPRKQLNKGHEQAALYGGQFFYFREFCPAYKSLQAECGSGTDYLRYGA